VVVAMPTLNQSERVIVDRLDDMMRDAEGAAKKRGMPLRRTTDNVRHKKWSNRAVLGIISMAEGSKKGAQGFTADILAVDEGHETTAEAFGVVEPTINVARKEGRARIIIVGIGGNDEVTSLIETQKYDQDGNPSQHYRALRITPDDICNYDPSYRDFYEQIRATTHPAIWQQHYDVLPASQGTQRVFLELPGYLEPEVELDTLHYEFAFDVGRSSDCTWGGVYEHRGNAVNLIDYLRLTGRDWRQQAAIIGPFVYRYASRTFPFTAGRYVRFETNGLGQGLLDEIRYWRDESGDRPFHNARGVHTSDQPPGFMKSTSMRRAMQAAYNGSQRKSGKLWFGVGSPEVDNTDQVTRMEALRRAYLKYTYEVLETGLCKWPHSDELASVWIQFSRQSRVYGV
jgi:hypothetical protein